MKRRTLLAITGILLVTMLSTVFYFFWYVPHSLGVQYLSASFSPSPLGVGESDFMHLDYEGKAMNADCVCIEINVTNSYFQPVYVSYNGFDVVWLIYNKTVPNPSDVVSNRNFLVWGAYYYLVYEAIPDSNRGVHDFTGDGFEFYSSRRESSNFQTVIPTGTFGENYGILFIPDIESGRWYGQYYFNTTSFVSPATYFMYCIVYGILCPPQNVTVTSINPSYRGY